MRLTPYQRDIAIRTIIGEAAGESPVGQAAVAHVLMNRARDERWPSDIAEVALQPKQFSAWNSGAGGNNPGKWETDSKAYQNASAALDYALASEDPTGGATHYYSPAGMQALVDQGAQTNLLPRWLDAERERSGGVTTIGGHHFVGRASGSSTPTLGQATGAGPNNNPMLSWGRPQAPTVPQFDAILSGGRNNAQGGRAAIQPGGGNMPKTVSTTLPVTPQEIARRRAFADAMAQQAEDVGVIRHPLQGLDQMGKAALSGLAERQAMNQERARHEALVSALGGITPGTAPTQAQIAQVMAVSPRMGMDLQGQAARMAEAERARIDAAEAARNEFKIQTIYDEGGNEQKVKVYGDGRIENVGGPKSNLLTEEELAQKQSIAASGAPRTNVTVGGKEQDKDYAKRANDWMLGGSADAAKQIAQLDSVLAELQGGANVTGVAQGAMPDWLRSALNPQGQAMKDRVEEVVQRSLRTILGAQFTEKEGERLIARAYNVSLPEEENVKRLTALVTQLKSAKEAQDSAAEYFRQNQTLDGWEGRIPQIGDFAVFDDPPEAEAAPEAREVAPGVRKGGRVQVPQFKEGAIARNPETGERRVFRNGQWVPVND